jgi:ATP-binding cassette subfamily B protein
MCCSRRRIRASPSEGFRYGRGTLRLLAPVLSRRNRIGIAAGAVLAVIAIGLLGLIP